MFTANLIRNLYQINSFISFVIKCNMRNSNT